MSIYLIILILIVIASTVGLYGMFEKAGIPGWKVLIPFYNFYVWLKIIEKPLWWYIFLLIPFINVFTIMLMVVEFLKNFKRFSLGHQALAVLFPYIYLPYLGFSKEEPFTPTHKLPKIKKTVVREWVDAIIFAVIAATIIRTFLIEAYTIPTSSMEKSMLVGDFLFVSKVAYGPKVPNTPLSFPFVHHTIPIINTRSYLEWIKLPYYRFPGLGKIDHQDVVVFNFPAGDTVALRVQEQTYSSLVRRFGRDVVWNNPRQFGEIVARPVDKRENYVKRCVALPGDTLEVRYQQIFINGQKQEAPEGQQMLYNLTTKGMPIHASIMEKHDITEGDTLDHTFTRFRYHMTDQAKEALKRLPTVISVEVIMDEPGVRDPQIFPHHPDYNWNKDHFGPLYIPQAGSTIQLTEENLPLYWRIIQVYEGNTLEVRNGKIFINGQERTSYTFEMDYFWMMGDNRHNSLDARNWGFVPQDHIVGKASFVWLSLDPNKRGFFSRLRYDKIFRVIR